MWTRSRQTLPLLLCAGLAILAACQSLPAQSPQSSTAQANAVTFKGVRRMLQRGDSEEEILGTIKRSPTRFVLSADDEEKLRSDGASDPIIAALKMGPQSDSPQRLDDLVIVLDYSKSMQEPTTDGKTKMEVAREVVSRMVEAVPDKLNVAFVIYGHRADQPCQAVAVIRDLAPLNQDGKEKLLRAIQRAQPVGKTPIALSLRSAGELLEGRDSNCGLVLISDGKETCNGDPAGEAARLASRLKVTFAHVVGFAVDDEGRAQLRDVADKVHGTYDDASDAESLARAMASINQGIDESVNPPNRPLIPPARGGATDQAGQFFHNAGRIDVNTEYDGKLPMVHADYYQVPVRAGQDLRAILDVTMTPFKAHTGTAGFLAEGTQRFSITVYDQDLVQVHREDFEVNSSGQYKGSFRARWSAERDGVHYIAVGASDAANGWPQPESERPEPSTYTLNVKTNDNSPPAEFPGIPRVKVQPGNSFDSAGDFPSPALAQSDLKIGEERLFRIGVREGETLRIAAAFQKPWYSARGDFGSLDLRGTFHLRVFDDDEVEVAAKSLEVQGNPPDASSLLLDWPVELSGNAWISVSWQNTGGRIDPAGYDPKPGWIAVQVSNSGADKD